jgi:ankyrin repeat protein
VHGAILKGDATEAKRLILDPSNDINYVDDMGKTALLYTAESGLDDVVEACIIAGAKAEFTNKEAAGVLDSLDGYEAYGSKYYGYTALMMATKGGFTDVINKLLDAGARTDIGSTYPFEAGVTALMFAIERKQGAAAEMLIQRSFKGSSSTRKG